MSYEETRACHELDRGCWRCGRPLLDALSVELGIGPTCREKLGITPEMIGREDANKLINKAVYHCPTVESFKEALAELRALGFAECADRLARNHAQIEIAEGEAGCLVVKAPFAENFSQALKDKGVRGHRFNKETCLGKAWIVPTAFRRQLFEGLKALYPGVLGIGPKGPFVLA